MHPPDNLRQRNPSMHIEPGILSAPQIAAANATALATLAAHSGGLVRRPLDIVKTLLAAAAFSLLMEIWHQPVGPSELHFIGASTIYFLFGFVPTLFGFAIGLALQALLFGIGHAYEGPDACLRIALYGALFGVIAMWRNSLRAGMVAHACSDITAGLFGF